MNVEIKKENAAYTIAVTGKLDTSTAPQLEEKLEKEIDPEEIFAGKEDKTEISFIMDFAELGYISSAGLRVILSFYKKINNKGGKLIIKGANQTIREILEMTGFSNFIIVEQEERECTLETEQ